MFFFIFVTNQKFCYKSVQSIIIIWNPKFLLIWWHRYEEMVLMSSRLKWSCLHISPPRPMARIFLVNFTHFLLLMKSIFFSITKVHSVQHYYRKSRVSVDWNPYSRISLALKISYTINIRKHFFYLFLYSFMHSSNGNYRSSE